jgi:hypothetical protein
VVRWLEAALGRVDAWRASASRAGSELTLSFILSWYPEVSLDQLASRRAGVDADLEPLLDATGDRASDIASHVIIDEFVKEWAETG